MPQNSIAPLIPAVSAELSAHPDKQLVYSSPSIHERRRRILREARRLLAESGLEKFSIRTLCKRADVAQRTLYNAFHNRDRITPGGGTGSLDSDPVYDHFNPSAALTWQPSKSTELALSWSQASRPPRTRVLPPWSSSTSPRQVSTTVAM